MKRRIFTGALIGIIGVTLLLGVMTKDSYAQRPSGRQEAPKVLRIGMVPAEDIAVMIEAFGPAKQYLEKELGMEIELFRALDYTAVIEAMRAKKVDVAWFGPFAYVLAAKRANARAIVAGGDAAGKLSVYHSILITRQNSGLRSIDDVKARVGGLTVSFADPASTSGHLIPRGFMESVGIKVDDHFRRIIFAGGHDASILAVNTGKVDFGATWEGPYQRAIDRGLITRDNVPVIWRSNGIPTSPIAVRGDLGEALILRIQQAFLAMPSKAPEAFAKFEAKWHRNRNYVVATDADYEFIRQVAIGLGKL